MWSVKLLPNVEQRLSLFSIPSASRIIISITKRHASCRYQLPTWCVTFTVFRQILAPFEWRSQPTDRLNIGTNNMFGSLRAPPAACIRARCISLAPLPFTRNAIVVTVHFRPGAVLQEECRLATRRHLRAIDPSVALEMRLGLDLLQRSCGICH